MCREMDHHAVEREPVGRAAAGGERVGYVVTDVYKTSIIFPEVGDVHRLRVGRSGRKQEPECEKC